MSTSSTRAVLLVEDNAGDARLLREMLGGLGPCGTEFVHVECMAEAEKHLADHAVDAVLLDLGLVDVQGLETIRRAQAAAPRVALVVVTGLDDDALALHALQEGAQDYLIKGQIEARGLQRTLRHAIERKRIEQALLGMADQMAHSAEHDFLTGLPNRMLLNDRISQAIAAAPRHKNQVAVLFLDVDGFKHINDSLGHAVGDELLQSIAERLVKCVRTSDTVSRQGGDEFVVLLSAAERWEGAAVIARRMLQAVAEAHNIGELEVHVTTSIGVSLYPEDGLDAETLIKNADTAMYQAKEGGRPRFQFFEPSMNARAVERQFIEESLRGGLERKEFVLHYQPRVDLTTGTMTGAEALIRWIHPNRGEVSTAQFISVAEECGLMVPIGKWVLREACEQTRAWLVAGLPLTTIAVNVSATELRDERFLEGVLETLSQTGLDAKCLELELTESVLMNHAESTAATLQTLREKGVRVAVDNFGTGYSSLSYLARFPIDALKIDQSFVRQISTAPGATNIVTALISMGRSLKLRVAAEGVETQEELAFLQARECDEAQGYYFSRPVPAEAFASLLGTGLTAPGPTGEGAAAG